MKNIIQVMLVAVLCLVLAVPVFAAGRTTDGMTGSTYRTNVNDGFGTNFSDRVDNSINTRGKMFNSRDGVNDLDGMNNMSRINNRDGFRTYNATNTNTGNNWGWLGLLGLLGLAGMFNRNRAR